MKGFCVVLFIIFLQIGAWAQKATPVVLQLKWQHQFQFAGYYAAVEKGFYQRAGLDVTILPALPKTNSVDNVLNGKAQFGIGASDLVLRRAKGDPIVIIASIFQHSPQVLLCLKRNDTQSIHDLVDKSIMFETDSAEILAYLKNEGIDLNTVHSIPHTYQVKDLINGNVDAMTAYVTTEPFELKQQNIDYVAYSPRSNGIDFYSDNLFTSEQFLKSNPQIVEAFRTATIKGWYYAMHNKMEMVDIIHDKYHSALSKEHLLFEAKQMDALLQTDLIEIGHINPNRWNHIINIYSELGMIKAPLNLESFLYTNSKNQKYTRLYLIIAVTIAMLVLAVLIAYRFIRLSQKYKKSLTQLKQTQSALNISDSKYQLLVENNHNIIFSLTPEGNFSFISQVIYDQLGYQPSEILNTPFSFKIHPEDLPICLSFVNKVLFYGEPQVAIEYRALHKNGQWQWFSANLSPLKDENNTITSLIGSAYNITPIKEAQLKLKESEFKHKLLTDLSGDIIVMHRNFEKYYVNPAVEKILGYTQTEFLNFGILDLIHVEDIDKIRERINSEKFTKEEQNYSTDFRLRHKSGHYLNFSAHVILHQTDHENYITVINLRDVTNQVYIDRELRKLSTAVNQSQTTIVITDTNGIIEYVNPHFTKITGYTAEEAIGQNPKILQSNLHTKEFYQEMWQILLSGQVWKGEIYNRRKDGSFYWEEAIMAPVFDERNRLINFVAIKNDITLRKEIETKLKVQNEELQKLVATKDRFISIIAHDLRNPFHSIIGLSEILSETIKDGRNCDPDVVHAIHSTTVATSKLLHDLLEWAYSQNKNNIPKFTQVSLLHLVNDCIETVEQNAKNKGVLLTAKIDNNFTVYADSNMLKTVIRNILTNAVKFSSSGKEVIITSNTTDNQSVISIKDNGIGMRPETIKSLFSNVSFDSERGTDGERGTGFGLKISKELIDKHYGTITVNSILGEGSEFIIKLPIQPHL